MVAARLAARQALTPDVLADQLAATEDRLRHLEYDDLSVRRSLAVAHDALAASGRRSDRDAALALCRIGALDLPTYGVPLVARLLGTDATDETRAEDALDRLVDVALLEETAYGRYAPHGLVRDFARELAATGHAPDIVRTALRWYAAVAERALTAIVEPGLDLEDRRRPTAAQPPEHAAHVLAIPPFTSSEKAFAWGSRSWRTSWPWPNGTRTPPTSAPPPMSPPCCGCSPLPPAQRPGRRDGDPRPGRAHAGAAARRRGGRGVRPGRPGRPALPHRPAQ